MAMNATPTAYLKMVHTDLVFGQFEASLYRPAGKGRSKQFFQSDIIRARQHVRDKILNLIRVQNIAGHNKAMSRTRQRILALFAIKLRPFHFPDHRTFFAFFNIKLFPSLLLKFARKTKQVLNLTGGQCFGRKTRKMPLSAFFTAFFRSGMKENRRLVMACRQSSDKRWALNLYEKPAQGPWQKPRTMLHGNAPASYTRWQAALALGPDGKTIHMSFMLYEQSIKTLGYAVGYLRSADAGQT